MSLNIKVRNSARYLESLGFDGQRHQANLYIHLAAGSPAFTITETIRQTDGDMHCCLAMGTNQLKGGLHLDSYSARFVKDFTIPHGIVNGINTLDLQKLVEAVNWNEDHRPDYDHHFSGKLPPATPFAKLLSDIDALANGKDPGGAVIRDQLYYKYLMGTGVEWFINCHAIIRQFESTMHYSSGEPLPTVSQAYDELRRELSRQQLVHKRSGIKIRHINNKQGRGVNRRGASI